MPTKTALLALGFPFGSLIGSILNVIGKLVRSGIDAYFTSAVDGLARAFTSTTQVNLGAPFFLSNLKMVQVVCGSLALGVLIIGIVQSLFSGSVSNLLKLVALQLPASVFAPVVSVYLTSGLNSFANYAAGRILASSGGSGGLVRIADRLISATGVPGVVGPALVLLTGLAAMGVWIELIVRASAIYLMLCLVPVAALGLLSQATRHWLKRLTEVLVGLILVKVVIAISLSLAIGAILDSVSGSGGFGILVEGFALLMVTLMSPYALVRLLPFAELQVTSLLEQTGVRSVTKLPRTALAMSNLQLGGGVTYSYTAEQGHSINRLGSWVGHEPPSTLAGWDGDFSKLADFGPGAGESIRSEG